MSKWIVSILLTVCIATGPTVAQNPILQQAVESQESAPPEGGGDTPVKTVESVEATRNEVATQLESAATAATPETAEQLGIPLDALKGKVDRLRALDSLLQQQLGSLQRLEEQFKELLPKEMQKKLPKWEDPRVARYTCPAICCYV